MKKSLLILSSIVAAMFALQPAVAADAKKADPSVASGEGCADVTAGSKSTKSRDEVKKEATAANKTAAADKGEGCVNPTAGTKSTKARADVKKEATAAVKAGKTGGGEADVKK